MENDDGGRKARASLNDSQGSVSFHHGSFLFRDQYRLSRNARASTRRVIIRNTAM